MGDRGPVPGVNCANTIGDPSVSKTPGSSQPRRITFARLLFHVHSHRPKIKSYQETYVRLLSYSLHGKWEIILIAFVEES